jgi:hypothetical protein
MYKLFYYYNQYANNILIFHNYNIILYNFNEKISGTPKKTEKEMGSLFKIGHF